MNHRALTRFWMPTALLLIMSGCARNLSEPALSRAIGLQNSYSGAKIEVEQARSALRDAKQEPDAAFLRLYAQRESWESNFTQAKTALDQAQTLLSQEVQPAIKRNERRDETSLSATLDKVELLLQQARSGAQNPRLRAEQLNNFRNDAPMLVKQAEETHRSTESDVDKLASQLRAASKKYPGKKADLNAQIANFERLKTQSAENLKIANAQLEGFSRAQPVEFPTLERSCQQVAQLNDSVNSESQKWQQKITELGQSHTQTLVDMKVDYYVGIGRESWNESSESEWTNEYVYPPRLVDKPTYDYFARFAEDQVLATQGSGWFSGNGFQLNNGVDPANWSRLSIDPSENLSEGTAEWSLDGVDEKYFHKYVWVRNGIFEQTDWQPVTLAFFEAHDDDLGMDISSKAPGTYESETTQFASPAGMSYVGNPQYGRWRSDSNGNRFWQFASNYLIFNALLGSSRRYSAAEWTDWNRRARNRTSYYGQKQKEEEEDRYGSHSRGVGGNSYFSRSHWVSSGEHRAQVASVRGAGSAARGGGPGGGGK